MVHVLLVLGIVLGHVRLEDTRGVVHRAALQAGEREDGRVAGLDGAAELGAHRTFVADHVGPGATQAGRTHGLVGIDHDMVLGGLHNGVMVVVDEGLAVVVLAVRDDLAHIAALHGIVPILVHEVIGLLHPTLVIDGGRRTFMMHDQADTLLVRILVQGRQVKVRIRGDEVEDEVLLVPVPVLPAFVPTLDEEGVEAVLRGKVDVTAHIFIVRAVTAVGLGGGIVRHAQLDGRVLVGIGPLALAGDHLPPDAHVLGRVDPGDVLDGAGLVEVQDEAGGEHVRRLLTHHHGTPGALARGLETALHAFGIRSKPGTEGHRGVVQVQVRRGIIQHFGLMDVDVQAVGGLHLESRLHAGRREGGLWRAAPGTRVLRERADLGELGLRGAELLRGIVARNPPGRMVAGHGELREFLPDLEVGQCVLQREFVPEAQAVVVQAEADLHHGAALLVERHEKLIVMVPDGGLFAPDRLPRLVERVECRILEREPAVQVLSAFQQGISQAGRQDDGLPGAVQRVLRHAFLEAKLEFQLPVRTAKGDGIGGHLRGLGPAARRQHGQHEGRKGKT